MAAVATMTSAPVPLSVCTFNVNSLREVCDRNGFSAGAGEHRVANLLQELGCDIVCFQECKLSNVSLKIFQSLSQAPGWDSYFSFARNPPLANFAGVATFCNTNVTIPRAAEEGLCRVLPPQNPAAAAQDLAAAAAAAAGVGSVAAASAGVKPAAAAGLQPWPSDLPFPQEQLQGMFTAGEAAAVDVDGRCVMTDHGLFILINVYLPAATGGDTTAHGRDKVKMDMMRALDARLRCFLAAGRNVLAVGDFNIAALPEDLMATPHPYHDFSDLHLQSRFYRGSIPRVWLRSIIAHNTPAAAAAAAAGSSDTSAAEVDQQQQQGLFKSCLNAAQRLSVVTHSSPAAAAAADQTRLSTADPGSSKQQQQQHTKPLRSFYMIDSLRRLIPEGFAVYPDLKKGGTKIRPLFTAWDITRNIRNDQHGGRVDYLLVGDAAAYKCEHQQQQQQQDVLKVIMPAVVAAAAAGAPLQQQQQHGYLSHLNMSMPISQYLSAAYIDRERRWSDHAAVVLKLLLPPAAAELLLPPHGSTAAGSTAAGSSSSSNVLRSAAGDAYMHVPTMSSRYLCDKLAAAAAAACIAAAAAATAGSGSSIDLQKINSSSKVLGCNIVDTLLKHKGIETEEARVVDRAQALYPASAAAAAASTAAFCDLYAGLAAPAAAAAVNDSSISMSDSLAAAPAAAAGLLPGEVHIQPSSNAPTIAFEPFVQRALHNEQIRQLGNAGVVSNHKRSNVTEGLAGLVKQHRRELDESRDQQQQQRQRQRQVILEQRQLKRRLVLRTIPAAVAAAAQDLAAAAAGAGTSSNIASGSEITQDQSKVDVQIQTARTNLDLPAAAAAAAVKLDSDQSNVAVTVKSEQQGVVNADHHSHRELGFSAASTAVTMPAAAAAAAAAADACRIQGVYFEGLQMACTSSEEDD